MAHPPLPWGQSHVLSHLLRAQLPSRRLRDGGKVKQRQGVGTAGFRKGQSFHPPAASRGEEVINKGSCLLSTWDIPGTMTKTR